MLLEMLAVMLPLLLRPTSMMPLVMLVAMMPLLPLNTSTRRSPLRSMCMTHLARPTQQLSLTSTLSPSLPPSPLLPQPSPPPQQLLLPLPSPLPQPSELSDTEPDTEPLLVEPSLVAPFPLLQLSSTTSGNQPKLSDRSPKCLVKEKPYHIDTISIPSNVITKSQVTCKKARKASQKNKGNYIGSKYYG